MLKKLPLITKEAWCTTGCLVSTNYGHYHRHVVVPQQNIAGLKSYINYYEWHTHTISVSHQTAIDSTKVLLNCLFYSFIAILYAISSIHKGRKWAKEQWQSTKSINIFYSWRLNVLYMLYIALLSNVNIIRKLFAYIPLAHMQRIQFFWNLIKAKHKTHQSNYRHGCILILLEQRNRRKSSRQAMPHILLLTPPIAPRGALWTSANLLDGEPPNLRRQMRFRRRIHGRGRRALHIPDHDERAAALAHFRSASPGDLARRAISPGLVHHLALGRNPRIGVGGGGGPRVSRELCRRRGVRGEGLEIREFDRERFAGLGGGVRGCGGVDYGPQSGVVEVLVVGDGVGNWGGHLWN